MKPSKYKNIPCECDGLKFGSKKELARYAKLKLYEKAGAISGLKTQVEFELIPSKKYLDEFMKVKTERKCSYIADFVYYSELEKKQIIEDVKGGKSTPDFIIKRKLMLQRYDIRVMEIR